MRWTDNSFSGSGPGPAPDAWLFLARTPLALRFGGSDPGFEQTTDTSLEHYTNNNWTEYICGRVTKMTGWGKSSIILGLKSKLIIGGKLEFIGGYTGKIITNNTNENWTWEVGTDLPQEDAAYAKMDVVIGPTLKYHYGDRWEDTDKDSDKTAHTGKKFDIKKDYTQKFLNKCERSIAKWTEVVKKGSVERVMKKKTLIIKDHIDHINDSVKEMNTYTTNVKKWYTGDEKCNKLNWTVNKDAVITVDGLLFLGYKNRTLQMGADSIKLTTGTCCLEIKDGKIEGNKDFLDNDNLVTTMA